MNRKPFKMVFLRQQLVRKLMMKQKNSGVAFFCSKKTTAKIFHLSRLKKCLAVTIIAIEKLLLQIFCISTGFQIKMSTMNKGLVKG